MKITHIIESSGGSADFVLYLIKYLPNHTHNVVYGERTFGNRFDEIKKNNINAVFYKWEHVQREIRLWKDLKATVALYRLLKRIDSDSIHVHSSKAGFIGRFVCYLLGKKSVVYTPNGLAFLRKDVSPLKVMIYVMLERIANWINGEIISCSQSEAQALIDRGIKSRYINNGTEIFDYPAVERGDNHHFIIATTGRASIQKNPSFFNSIASYFEHNPKYVFLWIGGGELEHELSSKNIKITGWMNRSSVIQILAKADLYISTALWEGLPFAVLEAMNLNKPLLLSNCVGNVDLVQNNNGFIYETREEAVNLIKLLESDRELMISQGNNSHKLAMSTFNVVQMALFYENAYKDSHSRSTKS